MGFRSILHLFFLFFLSKLDYWVSNQENVKLLGFLTARSAHDDKLTVTLIITISPSKHANTIIWKSRRFWACFTFDILPLTEQPTNVESRSPLESFVDDYIPEQSSFNLIDISRGFLILKASHRLVLKSGQSSIAFNRIETRVERIQNSPFCLFNTISR